MSTDLKKTFNDSIAEISQILTSINILHWDASTKMPSMASSVRGKQMGTLRKIVQDKLLNSELLENVEKLLLTDSLTLEEKTGLMQVKEAIKYHKMLPSNMVKQKAELISVSEAVWREARANNDFNKFSPYLRKVVDMQRELAESVGYKTHPYEVSLSSFEPGINFDSLQTLFTTLKDELVPLVKDIHAQPKPNNDFLFRSFPVEQQRSLVTDLATQIGYDFSRGRLDTTTHPFEISMTPQDVRITTRFNPNFINAGMFGCLHEAGHAIYEQSVREDFVDTALTLDLKGLMAMGGASYGVHESQSRLWENRVGRSLEFWKINYPKLQQAFPGTLDDVSLNAFHLAINRSEPSLIRVEADELTYDLHIMLRVEIEIGLMDGSLSVDDLPEYWRSKMQEYLGVIPQTDSQGVLQDVHWSKALIGYFPSYTIGNIMSAQWMDTLLTQNSSIGLDMQNGQYGELKKWLTESILQHGRLYTPRELLQRVTGSELNAKPYVTYLKEKFTKLYGLS